MDKFKKIKKLPIIDFHSHLSAEEVYNNKRYKTLENFLLSHDHYKWRLIKNSGYEFIPNKEHYSKDDFFMFYESLKNIINNPIKEWFELEMKDILNIKSPLKHNKTKLRNLANKKLNKKLNKNQIQYIFDLYNVEIIYTTDNPDDDLTYHKKINNSSKFNTQILPTYRADNIFDIDENWINYIKKLSNILNLKHPTNTDELLILLQESIKRFSEIGSKLFDVSFSKLPKLTKTYNKIDEDIDIILKNNHLPTDIKDIENIQRWILYNFMKITNKNKMIIQLHLGPKRNNSKKMFNMYGKDVGCDSIGNFIDINILSDILNESEEFELNKQKFIIYNSNPNDLYKFITLADSFDNVKVGPCWWFLDNNKNINEFLSTLDNISVLGSFIGMTTDSRSFSSISRHKWFRDIIINYLRTNNKNTKQNKKIAKKIFYENIKDFLN